MTANPGRGAVSRLIDTYRTIIISLIFLGAGVGLLAWGYFIDKEYPFVSFIFQQVGAICLFSGVYTSVNDYFVRKNFETQIRVAIDFVRLDQSIKDFALTAIKAAFVWEDTVKVMDESSVVQMLVLRSKGFFEGNYERLSARLESGALSLTIILPNPNNHALMDLMSKKFSDLKSGDQLGETIRTVVNHWLGTMIYQKLSAPAKARLRVLLIDKYPLYSAYLFDQREFWYVPYHFRNDHQRLPVFIFRTGFERVEVYKDFQALQKEAKPHDLSQALTPPAPGHTQHGNFSLSTGV